MKYILIPASLCSAKSVLRDFRFACVFLLDLPHLHCLTLFKSLVNFLKILFETFYQVGNDLDKNSLQIGALNCFSQHAFE